MEGALGYVEESDRQLRCQEIQCVAAGAEYCLFEVAPAETES